MAFCTSCGSRLPAGARFCGNCGAAVVPMPTSDDAEAPVLELLPEAPAAMPVAQPVAARPMPAPASAAVGIPRPAAAPPTGRRHRPGLALLLALLIPGAGQAYNGQPFKALLLLLTSVLILPWLYSLYDARAKARRIVAVGGRFGRGGLVWAFIQAWLALDVAFLVLLGLTIVGVLT